MDRFCKRYLFVDSQESTNEGRSTSDLQNMTIFNWSPGYRDTSEGEGEWVRGFSKLIAVWNYPLSHSQ